MALIKSNVDNIPKDAIILSEGKAHNYQIAIVRNWDKLSEV
jgi:hypothetical protein